ncbi:unnamed protein product [Rhodiola kirilowii]
MNGSLLHKSKHLLYTTAIQCQTLLRSFAVNHSLSCIKQLHAHATVSGLLAASKSCQLNSNFATAYAACDFVPYARKLFDEIPERSLFLYNLIVRVLVRNEVLVDAVKVFVEMLEKGECQPDHFTYPFVVKACGVLGWEKLGGVVHGRLYRDGFYWGLYVQNSLMAMYLNWGCMKEVGKVFDAMVNKSVSSWNTIISGYFRHGYAELALAVYDQMLSSGVEPDLATVVSVLPACGVLDKLDVGRRVHEVVKEKGMDSDIAVRNALIDMYLKCSSVAQARSVFDDMEQKDVITWSSMINGYILNGDARNALVLFRLMQIEGVVPNSITITSILSACGNLHNLRDGRCLHGWAMRRNLVEETIVESSLIDMYAKCKRVDLSSHVLKNMPKKKTVSWNALLSGCIQNGLAREAIFNFKHMLKDSIYPDCATFLSLLPAYASLADSQQGVNIHGYILKCGLLLKSEVATGLVDIYAKSGRLDYAQKVFLSILDEDRDIVSWSAIIAGCGKHGHGESAISLFDQMVLSGVKPNDITFTSALHACSHTGLVDKGLSLFKFLMDDCQTTPRMDHYACIVDLLGRAGRLEEAYGMITTMPYKANHSVWGALLGSCVIHENVELGEAAASKLFELEPENTGNSVLLAKIYSAVGRWKDAERVRGIINEIGLRKAPAQSLIATRS